MERIWFQSLKGSLWGISTSWEGAPNKFRKTPCLFSILTQMVFLGFLLELKKDTLAQLLTSFWMRLVAIR